MTAPRIGVLALQGDVREHAATLARLGATPDLVRFPSQLNEIDALVLPGGESTTMSRLLRVFGLLEPLRERLAEGMPTFSTCAGAILLSRDILDGREGQSGLGTLDLAVRRNGYGRQVESFEADLAVDGLDGGPFRAVFIRAPVFERVGPAARVLASFGGQPVAIAQQQHLSLAFHPEMTGDDRLHRLFLTDLSRRREHAA